MIFFLEFGWLSVKKYSFILKEQTDLNTKYERELPLRCNSKLKCIETLSIDLKIDDRSVLYGVVYRRPITDTDIPCREYKTLILSGDFNVNLLDYDINVNVRNFVNLFISNNFLVQL